MHGRAPEIRRLTVVLLDCSTRSMVVRDGRIIKDSNEHRRKGMAKIGRWSLPSSIPLVRMLHSSRRSLGNTQRGFGWPPSMAESSTGARVSGTAERARAREERGRWRRTPRVSGGGRRRYIGVGERWRGSWHRQTRGAQHRAISPDRRLKMTQWVPLVSPTEAVSGLGRLVGLAKWVAVHWPLPLFFLFNSFLFVLFTGFNPSIWIQTYLQVLN
jgi:hypothetical protein